MSEQRDRLKCHGAIAERRNRKFVTAVSMRCSSSGGLSLCHERWVPNELGCKCRVVAWENHWDERIARKVSEIRVERRRERVQVIRVRERSLHDTVGRRLEGRTRGVGRSRRMRLLCLLSIATRSRLRIFLLRFVAFVFLLFAPRFAHPTRHDNGLGFATRHVILVALQHGKGVVDATPSSVGLSVRLGGLLLFFLFLTVCLFLFLHWFFFLHIYFLFLLQCFTHFYRLADFHRLAYSFAHFSLGSFGILAFGFLLTAFRTFNRLCLC